MTPQEAAVNTVGDERQYSVTNAAAGETHTIALFPADAVTVDADGVVTFADDEDPTSTTDPVGDDLADDIGNTLAVITVVNGGDITDDQIVTVDPVGGQITFTINSDDAVSVIPVVFIDADEDGQIDLDADNQPIGTELFGIGGMKTWLPAEATLFSTVVCDTTEGEVTTDVYNEVINVNRDEGYYTLDTTGDDIADVLVQFGAGETYVYAKGPVGILTPLPTSSSCC